MLCLKNSNPFLFLLLIAVIAVNVELDVFLPALPEMQKYFQTRDGFIEWVLTINFLGLCVSSFLCGYLSDIYGRKNIILGGMCLFLLGSTGCIFTKSFPLFLVFRFLQGLGCGAPATVSFAAICDAYNESKATQMISFFNGVITSVMVMAPFLGIFLTSSFGWRSNFIFIGILSLLAFFLLLFFFRETMDTKYRQQLNWKNFFGNLYRIICAKKFWIYGLIAILMYASIVTFLANFSLLTINHLHISIGYYGLLQSTLMLAFVTASFFCAWLMKRVSSVPIIKWGTFCSLAGSFILIGSIYLLESPILFTLATACFNVGAALLIAIFSTRAIHLFTDAKGFTSSIMGSLRMVVSAFLITLSTIFFNGTFYPLGWLILAMAVSVFGLIVCDKKITA